MRKTEFLQELRDALQGEVSAAVIQENVRYYDTYISQEAASGRREEDVIEEIGSPRLIARTIIDSSEAAGETGGYSDAGGSSYGTGGYGSDQGYSNENGPKIHYIDFSKWYWKLLAGLVAFAVMFLLVAILSGVLTVVGGLMALVLRFAGPLLLIWLIYTLLRGMRR
ncbi:MAG: DUF1700 domain-containing protein [Clostridium sp.]|nr:DUF1700 domain-containing protein [Clostridium sp.]MDY5482765.1 DUF1700 domain-containing protein [Clostridium sp.]